MPSKKTKRKTTQRRRQAANRRQQLERPKLYWLQRKAKVALWRGRRVWRVSWRYLRATWKVFAFVVVVIATVLGLYEVLKPRLSVSQVAPLDPSNPFTTQMAISNSGYFSLYDVNVKCFVHNVTTEGQATIDNLNIVPSTGKHFPEIRPDETATVRCPVWPTFGFQSPVKSADIEIVLDYKPEYLLSRYIKRFRFVTVRAADGNLRWIEQPPLRP